MIKKVDLFTSKRDLTIFLLLCLIFLLHSLYLEYRKFQLFSEFNTYVTKASVQKHYLKSKNNRSYGVLKLKSSDGFSFYTRVSKTKDSLIEKDIVVEIFTDGIGFYDYLSSFYANSKILSIDEKPNLRSMVNDAIASSHTNRDIAYIYQALFCASDVPSSMQVAFSNLGVSHIVAISGFHLGILSAIVYFLTKPIYSFFQDRYFPYANSKRDQFLIVLAVLSLYLIFLNYPPSLVRSFGMFVVGFILYDRGIKIISMQTLFVTLLLLLSLFPRLFYSIGFWLSALGVFYIFLLMIHYKSLSPLKQLVLISVMVYLYMIPISLYIFGNFSLYHPISIVLSMLFTPFYPLSIALHLIGYGGVFDGFMEYLLELGSKGSVVNIPIYIFLAHLALSFGSIFSKKVLHILDIFSIFIFVYAIYNVI